MVSGLVVDFFSPSYDRIRNLQPDRRPLVLLDNLVRKGDLWQSYHRKITSHGPMAAESAAKLRPALLTPDLRPNRQCDQAITERSDEATTTDSLYQPMAGQMIPSYIVCGIMQYDSLFAPIC